MSETATSIVFGTARALPHGPHRLTRDEVGESQRVRLFAALSELMATEGYPGITIGNLVTRAGVSRTTFYDHFDNKLDCLFAAYDRYVEFVMGTLTLEFPDDTCWHDFVADTAVAYLSLLTSDATATRAFLVEMDTAGPVARRYRRVTWQAFADVLIDVHATVRAREPQLAPLPRRAYLGLLFAIRDLVVEALAEADRPDLTALAADVTVMAVALFEGAAAAQARVHRDDPRRRVSGR